MIDFELTEDHEALVQTVREFVRKEVAPYIKEWDEKQHFEPAVLKKMAELNLLGVCIPEEYGGAGFDYISLGLVCEELEAVDTFLRVIMSVHTGLNSLTLLTWGTEEQKRKYLVPQAKGVKLDVLMDDHRTLSSIGGAHETQPVALFGIGVGHVVLVGQFADLRFRNSAAGGGRWRCAGRATGLLVPQLAQR